MPSHPSPRPFALPCPQAIRLPDLPMLPRVPARHAPGLVALAAALAGACLVGCAGLPPATAHAPLKSASDLAAARAFAAPAQAWPGDAWWHGYGDAQLDALIDEALRGAPNVVQADARLRQAQAALDGSAAARRPQLSAEGSITQQQQSENYLSPKSATPHGWHDYGRATLNAGFDLDLWGRTRAALAAATSEAAAAEADAAQARLVLTTSIASAYAELARLHAARDTAQEALAVRSKTAELFRNRLTHGLETRASLRQVEARRHAAEADLLSLDEQLVLQRHRLAALAGAGPDRGLALQRPRIDLTRSFGLPATLQADLLGRRPDIAAARLRAQSADRRIDEARAAFYPNVNLSAFIGVQSLGLDQLTRSGSTIGSIGPAISLPIFDGGRLRAQLAGSEAGYDQAVADYERTLVQALQEVADAAASQQALGGQRARTDDAVEAAREAWLLQQRRYDGGLATYLDVLSAEDTLLGNLRAQSDLASRAFALDVALVRALGGGYAAAPQPDAPRRG